MSANLEIDSYSLLVAAVVAGEGGAVRERVCMESGERMRLGVGVGEMWRERRDVGKWERNMVQWGV